MKLIDKYLLRSFLPPFIYCAIGFSMTFIIFDLFENLPDFIEGRTPMLIVFKYYLILLPSVLVRIVPISLLLGVLYSLHSLTKNNELTAMRASGVSLLRLMLPFVAVGLLTTLAVAAVNETIGPKAAFWCRKFVSQQKKTDEGIDVYRVQVALSRPTYGREWLVGRFDIRTYEMTDVVLSQDPLEGLDLHFRLLAKSAKWLDGGWWFSDVQTQYFDADGYPRGPPRFELTVQLPDVVETPSDFLSEIKDPTDSPDMFGSWELARYVANHRQDRDPKALNRITVDMHSRLAMPWACFIVTLLGIPFGNQTGRKGALLGIALAIGLFIGYYFLINTGVWMGKEMIVPAWVGGWLPNLFFLMVGLIMVYRMR